MSLNQKYRAESRTWFLWLLVYGSFYQTRERVCCSPSLSLREIISWLPPECEEHITNLPPDVKERMECIVSLREWPNLENTFFFFWFPSKAFTFPLKLIEIYISNFSFFASLVPLSSAQNPKPHHSLWAMIPRLSFMDKTPTGLS